jgi:hypothetical protein
MNVDRSIYDLSIEKYLITLGIYLILVFISILYAER